MQKLIDFNGVITDDWAPYDRFASPGAARRVLVTGADLEKYPKYFERVGFELALDVDPDAAIEDLLGWLPKLSMIRLNFASFADGRAFSQARLLRGRYAFAGDIRAHGEVLRDQLAFMARCGFNQFSLADGESTEFALNAFSDISASYQPELAESSLDFVVNS